MSLRIIAESLFLFAIAAAGVRVVHRLLLAYSIRILPSAQIADFVVLCIVALSFICISHSLLLATLSFIFLTATFYALATAKLLLLREPLVVGDIWRLRELIWQLPLRLRFAIAFSVLMCIVVSTLMFSLQEFFMVLGVLAVVVSLLYYCPQAIHQLLLRVKLYTPWNRYHPTSAGFFVSTVGDHLENASFTLLPITSKASQSLESVTFSSKRNVYVIIVEALSDPLRWELPPARDPLAPELRSMLSGMSLPPVYGGRSTESETELLTGVACGFSTFGDTFNAFTGERVSSLLQQFRSNGYRSTVFCATEPWFCNALRAYTSLGFDSIHLLDDFPKLPLDGGWTSTDAYLALLESHLQSSRAADHPRFTYCFLTSGHWPFKLHESRDPQLEFYPLGSQENAYCNCLYVNSRKAAELVQMIERYDPDAIVLLVGDHQPALPSLDRQVSVDESVARIYEVPYAIVDRHGPAAPKLLTHYQLPLELLTRLGSEAPPAEEPMLRPLPGTVLVVDGESIVSTASLPALHQQIQSKLQSLSTSYFRLLAEARGKGQTDLVGPTMQQS